MPKTKTGEHGQRKTRKIMAQMTPEAVNMLDCLAVDAGLSRQEYLERLIRAVNRLGWVDLGEGRKGSEENQEGEAMSKYQIEVIQYPASIKGIVADDVIIEMRLRDGEWMVTSETSGMINPPNFELSMAIAQVKFMAFLKAIGVEQCT